MTRLHVAHIREQGQNMIIVPLDYSFGQKTASEQSDVISEIQMRARSAGLAGKVVPVWPSGGRMFFIAPPQWRGFFQGISLQFVRMNCNKVLSW